MPTTEAGVLCPSCGKGKTVNVAVMPLLGRDAKAPIRGRLPARSALVEAGTYAVCVRCYKRQWADVYGAQFGGISYDEYLRRQAAE